MGGGEESIGEGSRGEGLSWEREGSTLLSSQFKNLRKTADDQQLKDTLDNIKSAKSSVRSSPLLFFLLDISLNTSITQSYDDYFDIFLRDIGLQAVINYGASW